MQAQTKVQAALISITLVIAASAAFAQETAYPKKGNVEITVLFPSGSSADVTARLLATGIGKHLGANVVTVNRPGAGGAIGYKHVASQKPDGYSLVWNSNSISTTYHSGQLPFDYKAFAPVARVLVEPPLLAVRADGKWKKLADLVADAAWFAQMPGNWQWRPRDAKLSSRAFAAASSAPPS